MSHQSHSFMVLVEHADEPTMNSIETVDKVPKWAEYLSPLLTNPDFHRLSFTVGTQRTTILRTENLSFETAAWEQAYAPLPEDDQRVGDPDQVKALADYISADFAAALDDELIVQPVILP